MADLRACRSQQRRRRNSPVIRQWRRRRQFRHSRNSERDHPAPFVRKTVQRAWCSGDPGRRPRELIRMALAICR